MNSERLRSWTHRKASFIIMPLDRVAEPGAHTLTARRRWRETGLLALLIFLSASCAAAQAAAEYGGAVAAVGAAAARSLPSNIESSIPQQNKPGSVHLTARSGDDVEAANRKALEARAGKESAKLTLRSTPANARVRVDGKPVGRTPLVLVVAPGTYTVDVEGLGTEVALRQVSLVPQETRELVLVLQTRYPAHVQLAWPTH